MARTSDKLDIRSIILAAGRSRRMKTDLNKVLHLLCGKPIVEYVIEAYEQAGIDEIYMIVGNDKDLFVREFGSRCEYVVQSEPLGTGHAVMQIKPYLSDYSGDVMILAGDSPFIDKETITRILTHHKKTEAAATLLTADFPDTSSFGRIVRNHSGNFVKIVEAKDASPAELAISEVNVTIYCFNAPLLYFYLDKVRNDNAQGEFYVTDIFQILLENGLKVETVRSNVPHIGFGINSPEDFEIGRKIIQSQIFSTLQKSGVALSSTDNVTIDINIKIGSGTVIHRSSVITGKSTIGSNCIIGPDVLIHNSRIGDHCKILNQKLINSTIPNDTVISP